MEVVWFSSGVLLSRFNVEVEAALPTAARTFVGNFRVPIAGHVDLDFGSVPARRIRPLDCAAGVHLHPGHVHIHIELYVADINELALRVSEFDEEFVVAAAELALPMNEINGQIIDALSCERRAGNFVRANFLPDKIARVKKRKRRYDQRNPS